MWSCAPLMLRDLSQSSAIRIARVLPTWRHCLPHFIARDRRAPCHHSPRTHPNGPHFPPTAVPHRVASTLLVHHPVHILGGGAEAAECLLVGERGLEALLDFRWALAACCTCCAACGVRSGLPAAQQAGRWAQMAPPAPPSPLLRAHLGFGPRSPHRLPLLHPFRASGRLANLTLRATAGACVAHSRGRLTVQGCTLECNARGLPHLAAPLLTRAVSGPLQPATPAAHPGPKPVLPAPVPVAFAAPTAAAAAAALQRRVGEKRPLSPAAELADPASLASLALPPAKRLCGWPAAGAGVLSVVETRIRVRACSQLELAGCLLGGTRFQF